MPCPVSPQYRPIFGPPLGADVLNGSPLSQNGNWAGSGNKVLAYIIHCSPAAVDLFNLQVYLPCLFVALSCMFREYPRLSTEVEVCKWHEAASQQYVLAFSKAKRCSFFPFKIWFAALYVHKSITVHCVVSHLLTLLLNLPEALSAFRRKGALACTWMPEATP